MNPIPYAEIRNRVSAIEAAQHYGIEVRRDGSALCPFHHDQKTASMKFYPGNRGFHCFGCNASGDVVKLVMLLFNITAHEAAKKLDADFGLGLVGNLTKEDYERIIRADTKRKANQANFNRDMIALTESYDTACWLERSWLLLWLSVKSHDPLDESDCQIWEQWQQALLDEDYAEYKIKAREEKYHAEQEATQKSCKKSTELSQGQN